MTNVIFSEVTVIFGIYSPAGFAQLNSPLGEGSEVVKKGSKQLTKKKTALGKQQQHQLHRGQGQCTSNVSVFKS